MIEIDGKIYNLRYNLKRIEIIENATKTTMVAEATKNNGMLSLMNLKAYFGYGLIEEGANAYTPPKKGMEIAEALIETEGYMKVSGYVAEALERDCPFFFLAG